MSESTPAEAPAAETKVYDPLLEVTSEPRNALTKAFTEDEWKALKEFRVCWYIVSTVRDADVGVGNATERY